ncbi:hypothetical protein ACNFJN_04600 [Xenorhabdus budapestensis]|uniref:Uncharacterized protein n=1 Tax=Xenorhabdus budapestensis TaxID=290110 RepID=A0ABX7VIL5_XENBU|nr:hypothetical protein [Xenorhabdus budapestensis]QTL40589.1 hypothetical protein HGO23_04140 [Xenorhabdus budapestensis]
MKYTSVGIEEIEGGCYVYAEWSSDGLESGGLLCTAYDVDGGVVSIPISLFWFCHL